MNLTVKTVQRALVSLRDKGYIRRVGSKTKSNMGNIEVKSCGKNKSKLDRETGPF